MAEEDRERHSDLRTWKLLSVWLPKDSGVEPASIFPSLAPPQESDDIEDGDELDDTVYFQQAAAALGAH